MIEHLKKLPPETVESFLKTHDSEGLGIPPKLAEYILQINDAARIHKTYPTISEGARQLQLLHPALSIHTCKSRLYDSINYLNQDCTVTEEAWLLFYADMFMELYEMCIKVDTQENDTGDNSGNRQDITPAISEARRCLEKSCEYRIRACSNAIDPSRVKFKHQIVSADMELQRMGVKRQGILGAYKKALTIIGDIDATDLEKRRIIDEVERELNVTDIPHETVGS